MATPRLKYNPSHMPEDELIQSFVVRQRDLAVILETVQENTGASNQHILILGPRGMGKTTLINRAVAEIRRDPKLSKLWYPILFDEESYTVTSAGELWFQALSHLADQTKYPLLESARRTLQTVPDRTRLRDASLARLLEFADAQQRRLLVTFENVDMIFDDQMVEDDGWDVRHTLQNEPRIMVLATSTTRLDSFHDSKKPLYELFREHTLERLDLKECSTVWQLVTGAELPLNQARPIQIFTGGNTRLLTILATFAKDRSFRELMDDLVSLIDENTSYFKHNIEALPKESRKIFVTLADLWTPATSRQVAEQTRGEIRAVSAQLGRLVDQGIIEVVRRVDKTQMFQVAERMYNLYYLLRRRGTGRVRAVVEFIIRYYDQDGMQRMLASMADEACSLTLDRRDDHVRAYCELMHRIPDLEQRHEAMRRAPAQFLEIPDIASLLKSMSPATSVAEPLDEIEIRARLNDRPGDVDLLLQLAHVVGRSGKKMDMLELAEQALSLDPTSLPAAATLTMALLESHSSLETRISCLRRSVARAAGDALASLQLMLAQALVEARHPDDARMLANDTLERFPESVMTATMIGVLFMSMGETQESLAALTHAVELDPSESTAVILLSSLLIDRGRLAAAEAYLRHCLELRPRILPTWLALGNLLANSRTDPASALLVLQKAESFHLNNPELVIAIGRLLFRLKDYPRAEEEFRRAGLEICSDDALYELIFALIAQKKFGEAHTFIDPRIELNPSPRFYLAAAFLHAAEGDRAAAQQHLRHIVASPETDSFSIAGAMMVCVCMDDIESGRKIAETHLNTDPKLRLTRLRTLCAFALESRMEAFYPDVLEWTSEISANPEAASEGNLLMARALGLSERWDEVWVPLTASIVETDFTRARIREIVILLSHGAALGHAKSALQVLTGLPSAEHFEPLVVALRRLSGEPTNSPQEVSEVADDIVRDIEHLRETLNTRPVRPPPTPPSHKQHRRTRKRSHRIYSQD